MRRVLITGVTGFIGSNLAREMLKRGYEVYGLARQPVNTEYISDMQARLHIDAYDATLDSVDTALKRIKPDVVYHLATCYAVSHKSNQIAAMNECNVLFGNYLLEAMKLNQIGSIVYTSTVFCNYNNEPYNPLNLYTATKRAFSDIMRYYTEAEGLRSLTLVLSDSYGAGDKRPKVLNLIKRAFNEGKSIELSSGTQTYDVLYVDDIVNALIMAGELVENQKEKSSVYQIYNAQPLTLRETAQLLQRTVGAKINIAWDAKKAPERSITEKVRAYPMLPDWSMRVSLEEGLKKFWYDTDSL